MERKFRGMWRVRPQKDGGRPKECGEGAIFPQSMQLFNADLTEPAVLLFVGRAHSFEQESWIKESLQIQLE